MPNRQKLLWAGVLAIFLLGVAGAIAYGYWNAGRDCRTWVGSHGYRMLDNAWWAKDRGCSAKTPDGTEIVHGESLGGKAIGWVWQLAIFAVGTLPAMAMIVYITRR